MPSLSASASQGPPHSPSASSWLPSQSQSPAGMPSPPQMPHSSRTLPSQSQSPSGMSEQPHLVDSPGPLHTPQASSSPTQGSCRRRCRRCRRRPPGPPHSPSASSWLPSQSQSPAGMPSPPQMPHSSRTLPLQSQSPSGMSNNRTRRWPQVRCTRHTRRVHRARVDVVADAVAVGVGLTRPAALTECVKLVAIAVAVPAGMPSPPQMPHSSGRCRQSQSPSGCRNRTRRSPRSVAHATGIEFTDAGSTSSQMPSLSASASQATPLRVRQAGCHRSRNRRQGCRRHRRCRTRQGRCVAVAVSFGMSEQPHS